MWARLLATAVTSEIGRHPLLREALRVMSPGEARILKAFGDRIEMPVMGTVVAMAGAMELWLPPSTLGLASSEQVAFCLANLQRIGFIERTAVDDDLHAATAAEQTEFKKMLDDPELNRFAARIYHPFDWGVLSPDPPFPQRWRVSLSSIGSAFRDAAIR